MRIRTVRAQPKAVACCTKEPAWHAALRTCAGTKVKIINAVSNTFKEAGVEHARGRAPLLQ